MSAIPAADYELLQSMLHRLAGIVLEPGKEYLLDARLGPLARQVGLATVPELVTRLRERPGELDQRVVEAMTIHETAFFRDWKPFEALRTRVLPELIRARESTTRKLVLWSAAASTGQEAYGMAMVLRENFPQVANWSITILATDLSLSILETARKGYFSQLEVNRGMPARLLTKYMKSEGAGWVVRDEIRRMVEFRPINLAKPWPLLPRFDLVFLRNVMIYFDNPTKRAIFSRVKEVSAPDSYLFLGAAESTIGLSDDFVKDPFEGACWYRQKNRGEVVL
jgi:chemotaxis protein methyltransferase CheR